MRAAIQLLMSRPARLAKYRKVVRMVAVVTEKFEVSFSKVIGLSFKKGDAPLPSCTMHLSTAQDFQISWIYSPD
jgi:hypothetical protein